MFNLCLRHCCYDVVGSRKSDAIRVCLVHYVTNMKKTLLRNRLWTSRGYAKGSRNKNISEANMFSVLPNFVLFHVCFNVICNFAQLRLAKLVCEPNKSESFYDNARCLDCTVYNRRFRIRLIYDFNFNSRHEIRMYTIFPLHWQLLLLIFMFCS